jgi:hypothetical protein
MILHIVNVLLSSNCLLFCCIFYVHTARPTVWTRVYSSKSGTKGSFGTKPWDTTGFHFTKSPTQTKYILLLHHIFLGKLLYSRFYAFLIIALCLLSAVSILSLTHDVGPILLYRSLPIAVATCNCWMSSTGLRSSFEFSRIQNTVDVKYKSDHAE